MARGLLKLLNIPTPSLPKKVMAPSTFETKPEVVKWDSLNWIDDLLAKTYQDKRPLWGEPRPFKKGWTPSSIGEPNDRMLVAGLLGYRGDAISHRLQLIFDAGNRVEEAWVKRFWDMGVYADSDVWIPDNGRVPSDLIIRGKADVIIKPPNSTDFHVVEVKSIAPFLYKQLPKNEPKGSRLFNSLMQVKGQVGERLAKYMAQLQLYLHCFDMKTGILLFDNKGTQEFISYHIEYNEEFVQGIFDRMRYLQQQAWEKGLLPPWSGGKSASVFAIHKPEKFVPVQEFMELMS